MKKWLIICMTCIFTVMGELPAGAIDWNNPFTDVQESMWHYEAVKFANVNALFVGMSADTFAPDANMTRAMFVRVLKNLNDRLGLQLPTETGAKDDDNYGKDIFDNDTPFADVSVGAWYSDAVKWAYDRGLVAGYSKTEFGLNGYVTRQEMCAFLYRFADKAGLRLEKVKDVYFSDHGDISEWASASVQAMAQAGIVSGMGSNRFEPKGTATRAQVAQIMKTFCAALARSDQDIGNVVMTD